MADHIPDAGKKVGGSQPASLSDWPIESLRYSLRREVAPGVHTYSTACCGHGHSRGGGYCADCLREEIDRREDGP